MKEKVGLILRRDKIVIPKQLAFRFLKGCKRGIEEYRNSFQSVFFLALVQVIFFWDRFSAQKYTSWDTFALYFTNVNYFIDSIFQGILPFWNPFQGSGVALFPNLNFVFLFSPLIAIQLILRSVFSPIYSVEMFLQFIVFIGAVGSWRLMRSLGCSKNASCFSGAGFILLIAPTILGQISFLASMAALPWMLHSGYLIAKLKTRFISLELLFETQVIAALIFIGFPFLNLANAIAMFIFCAVFFLGTFRNARPKVWAKPLLGKATNCIIFSAFAFLPYGLVAYLGVLDYRKNYDGFFGDFAPSFGFTRAPFQNLGDFAFDSLLLAVRALLFGAPWSIGCGLVIACLFLFSLTQLDNKRHKSALIYMHCLFLVGLLYSFKAAFYLPTLNRWFVIGVYLSLFATCCISSFAIGRLERLALPPSRKYFFYTLLIVISFFGLTTETIAQLKELMLLGCLLATVLLIATNLTNNNSPIGVILVGLFCFEHTVSKTLFTNNTNFFSEPRANISERLQRRINEVSSSNNIRVASDSSPEGRLDIGWFWSRIPQQALYNQLDTPRYAPLIGQKFIGQIVYSIESLVTYISPERKHFASDNLWMSAESDYVKQVAIDGKSAILMTPNAAQAGTFSPSVLTDFNLSPNSVKITSESTGQTFVAHTQRYSKWWRAFRGGEEVRIEKVNSVFMGARIPGGKHEIEFRYAPPFGFMCLLFSGWTIFLLSVIFCIIFQVKRFWYLTRTVQPKVNHI